MKTSAIGKICATLTIGIVVGFSHAEAGLWSTILKALGREVAEEGSETAVKKAIKTGASKVVRTMTKEELENLVGVEPVRRMSSLLNMRNINEAADLVAHNPSKEKIWKTLADCRDIEISGGSVRQFMRSSTELSDAFTEVNEQGLMEMYRYARACGLTSQKNLERMRQGLAPLFPDNVIADLDHIIPVKYAPELKCMPANIRILPARTIKIGEKMIEGNRARGADIDNKCLNKARTLMKKINWRPAPGSELYSRL